ncbi:MAG: hypothetical protein HBSAPP03_16410 [Phycisphaerae bacterium]|nr:MAG: hypothetical protein HBSAPP03_16410 [Phycisphaerae bacterium]
MSDGLDMKRRPHEAPCDPPDPPAANGEAAAARAVAERAAALAGEGKVEEARSEFAHALEQGGADVRVLFLCFQFHIRIGEYDAAEAFARRRLAAVGEDTATPHTARAYTNLGLVLHFRGNDAEARAAFERAIDIDTRLGFEYGLARDLGNLSLIPEKLGDFDQAESLLTKALEIAQRIGAEDLAATKYTNLGDIALARGQPEVARHHWAHALAIFQRLGPRKHFDEYAAKLAALDSPSSP